MVYVVGPLDLNERSRQKQDSRDRDAARLRSGQVSARDLSVENGVFSVFPLADFRIVSIGGRPLRAA